MHGNEKYVAIPWEYANGSKLAVMGNDKTGRIHHNLPLINNKSSILDFDFSPFDPDVVTTVGEDGAIKVFNIPEGGNYYYLQSLKNEAAVGKSNKVT